MQETCEKPLASLRSLRLRKGREMILAAKYAKSAKRGGQGLEAFAFSAFFAAK